jgi:hypothetical protein
VVRVSWDLDDKVRTITFELDGKYLWTAARDWEWLRCLPFRHRFSLAWRLIFSRKMKFNEKK